MNLKDKCAEDGITLAEGKEKYGLTHWNATVPDAVETESQEDPVEELVEAVVETVTKPGETDDTELLNHAKKLRTYIGEKSVEYMVFVRDNKDAIPQEYALAEETIKNHL